LRRDVDGEPSYRSISHWFLLPERVKMSGRLLPAIMR
jgi:hypothetical protein